MCKKKLWKFGFFFCFYLLYTYPNWTGPKVVCRAIASSLMSALVIDSVGFTPPSCCQTRKNNKQHTISNKILILLFFLLFKFIHKINPKKMCFVNIFLFQGANKILSQPFLLIAGVTSANLKFCLNRFLNYKQSKYVNVLCTRQYFQL